MESEYCHNLNTILAKSQDIPRVLPARSDVVLCGAGALARELLRYLRLAPHAHPLLLL